MFTPDQLRDYYIDFKNEKFKSAIALVHSRFSTNTFPNMGFGAAIPYCGSQR